MHFDLTDLQPRSDARPSVRMQHGRGEEGQRMGIKEVLKSKRKEILEIAARHGAYNVRVFGSVARGDARSDSDVDLLVDAGPICSFFFPGGLIADLQELLGKPVHVVTEPAIHWYIRDRVLMEAVSL